MKMSPLIVKEIYAKSILSESKVHDYVINPYVGCQHGCTYCYVQRYRKRFGGHEEPWGEFIDVKLNAPSLLQEEIKRKEVGRVWISGMCDPYQPLEKKYELTKRCLEILLEYDWPVTIQTKSPLVLRDIELFKKSDEIEVGLTITTADEKIREIFEPRAPPIKKRIDAVKKIHLAGIKTYVMIGPILPRAEELVEQLNGKVDYVIIDRMNYHYGDWVYKKYNLEHAMSDDFFNQKKGKLIHAFEKLGISCRAVF
ncbi:MAG: radical SAM protein [Candidatus Aenigmarchaeota archaeon]|nr:radical SAM protein [Candidatus Aenigmarchaeota archaeon]